MNIQEEEIMTAECAAEENEPAGGKAKEKHDHYGHRNRLRERFRAEGLEHFEDHNILELLLFYTIPRRDTNEIAHKLIKRCGSLSAVFDASPDELKKEKWVTENTALLLNMLPQLFRAYTRDKEKWLNLEGRENIENYIIEKLSGETNEKVWLVCIDNKFRRLYDSSIGEGSVNFAAVDKRKMVELLLRYNATGAIIAHNHPGGFAVPSSEDIEMTIEIKKVLQGIGVTLLDHIIVCRDDYTSLADNPRFAPIFSK